MEAIHTPVLLRECLEYLAPESGGLMIDATLGEGGHAEAFLKRYSDLRIVGLDCDPEIQARAKARLSAYSDRMDYHRDYFNDFFANFSGNDGAKVPSPDVILFDLGISIFHYELSERGFSFRKDEALDMRLNPSVGISAAELVVSLSQEKLADVLYRYGDERYSRRIAASLKAALPSSAAEAADIVYHAVPEAARHGKTHPATKTFQALRIAVNAELTRLTQVLPDAFSALKVGGKLGVITFHSLEDRIVKNFFRGLGKQCVCPPEQPICVCGGESCAVVITRKAVSAQTDEVAANPPSRSAHLRVLQKLRDMNAERQVILSAANNEVLL